MRVRIGTRPVPDVQGLGLCLLQHGVIISGDGPTRTLDFPIGDIARESHRLLRLAVGDLADDTFAAYGAPALIFELFINLAKVGLALGDRPVTKATLADGLAHWQPRASIMRDLRVFTHHALLRMLAETDRRYCAPPLPKRPRWMFLWARPPQNRSLTLLRSECDAHGDTVLDLELNVSVAGRAVRATTIPAPWRANGREVWQYRRLPIRDALRVATIQADAIRDWVYDWKRIELDPRSLVRAMLYDLVLGDALEGMVTALQPEALVCSMVWGIGYQAASRANVRCVEFLHGSVEEGLAQPVVARPRQIVGATHEELAWLETQTGQRFVEVLSLDPATEEARGLRARRVRARSSLRVAYFPTYTASVFGGSDRTRIQEDAIVREMAAAVPEIQWQIKPHPADVGAVARFGWARAFANIEVLEAAREAMELLPDIDAAVHCGSSIEKPMSQLGIPQLEIALEGRQLSTAVPSQTTIITDSHKGLAVLKALKPAAPSSDEVAELALRDRILIQTPRTTTC